MIQTIIYIVIALVVVGGVLWLISLLPMDPTIKRIINGCVIFAVVLVLLFWLLQAFGGHEYRHGPY